MGATGPGLIDEVEVPVAFAVVIVLGHDGVDGCSVLPAGVAFVALFLRLAVGGFAWTEVWWVVECVLATAPPGGLVEARTQAGSKQSAVQ